MLSATCHVAWEDCVTEHCNEKTAWNWGGSACWLQKMMNSFDRSNNLNFLRASVPLINGWKDNECVPDSVETFTPEVKKIWRRPTCGSWSSFPSSWALLERIKCCISVAPNGGIFLINKHYFFRPCICSFFKNPSGGSSNIWSLANYCIITAFLGVGNQKINKFINLSKIRLNSCRIDIYIYEGIKASDDLFSFEWWKVDYERGESNGS